MHRITDCILSAPAYLVFLVLTVGLALSAYFSRNLGHLGIGFVLSTVMKGFFQTAISLWYYSIATGIEILLPPHARPKPTLILLGLGLLAAFGFQDVCPYLLFGNTAMSNYLAFGSTPKAIIVYAALAGLLYVSAVCARVIIAAEPFEKPASRKVLYASMLFVLFLLYYVGVWFIQPKVNRLYREAAHSAA
jgi:hypothetical protein